MQFVSWLSGHSDDAWLRRMSVLSMRSSSAGMNPTITLDELQDRCNFHQRRLLMPGGRLIRTFLKDRVARIGSSVMLPGPLPAARRPIASRYGKIPDDSGSPSAWPGSRSVV
jgi:hypothetical protein